MAPVKGSSSRQVRVSTGGYKKPANRRLLGYYEISKERKLALERASLNEAGLDDESQGILSELRRTNETEDVVMGDNGVAGDAVVDDDGDDSFEDLPESLESNKAFVYALRDVVGSRWRIYKDNRTWRQRVQRADIHWEAHIPELVSGYLKWKYPSSDDAQDTPPIDPPTSPESEEDLSFTLELIDIFSLGLVVNVERTAATSVSGALVSQGLIGNAPLNPSIAISIKTLELYRRLRLRKPSLSVEAFAKVICDFYSIPYRRGWHTVLGDVFDVYLAILRDVDKQVKHALKRDTPDWRVLNACPPCTYHLEGEPPQTFGRVMAFDGNNSMKRMYQLGDRRVRDMKPFTDSDYLITPEYVDKFKDEVQSRRGPAVRDTADVAPDLDVDGSEDPYECTTRYKAAASEDQKTTWGVFQETGWFVSACRHSLILWFSDMIRSGELAKHPLAHISKALDILEERLLVGSDIGCSLSKTIASSSLGPKFKARKCRCCVNTFHGYTHNWTCQKVNHPNVVKGIGLEDLETLERIFSSSNAVASLTRYATAYRRRVYIDLFLQQWDEEKYLNLGTMMFNNYLQARHIISTESVALADALQSLGATVAQLESWEDEEVKYFKTLGQEPEWDAHAVVYVELLQELRDSDSQYQNRNSAFLNCTPDDYQFTPAPSSSARTSYDEDLSRTRKAETVRRVAAERRQELLIEVVSMEVKMGIEKRWQPSDPHYLDTVKYMALRKYHKALDHLQKLVIQRLFELNKLNIAGTGYRMRTHIAKSINTRCKAIENAVKKYNTAATSVHPPRPTLDWSKASHYAFLEEFELLRDTRQDIRAKPWAQPVARVAMKQAQRIVRAHEEIDTCNIQVRRLHTHILDENADLEQIIPALRAQADPIAGAVEDYSIRRRAANMHLLKRVHQIHAIEGYSGNTTPGQRVGRAVNLRGDTGQAIDGAQDGGDDDWDDLDDLDDDDEARGEYGGLIDYVSEMPLRQ